MKRYEILVDESKAEELTHLLERLPYVKKVKECAEEQDVYSIASEESLAEDWNSEEDDELQKLYGK
jgi:uncharacterized protein YlbG (UPF0298 family)